MSYEDLKILDELREKGSITEEEYQIEKQKVMNKMNNSSGSPFWGMSENSYIALMHFSQFAGYIILFLGFIMPIIMWMINKDNSIKVDQHGKNIVNFLISWIIYAVASLILVFLVIGLPMLIALGVLQIVFIIMAGLKASNGEYWKYPLSITFLK